MRFLKNSVEILIKAFIAAVCLVNFILLLIDLSQLQSSKFWAAIVPFSTMLFLNAFLIVGVCTQNELSMFVWLFSYSILIILGAAFLLSGKIPFFLPIASQAFSDWIAYTNSYKTGQLPICGMALSVFCYLTVMAAYALLLYFNLSQEQVLPLRHRNQSPLTYAVRNNPEIQPDSLPPPYSVPPPYSEGGKLPTYNESIIQCNATSSSAIRASTNTSLQHSQAVWC